MRLKVWHIPQIPGKPFEVEVDSLATAKLLCDVLARYDIFQFENRIKPDFANTNGIVYLSVEGDWCDIDPEDPDEMEWFAELLAEEDEVDGDFGNNFGRWLEANGVTLGPWMQGAHGFVGSTVDLNILKVAMARLARSRRQPTTTAATPNVSGAVKGSIMREETLKDMKRVARKMDYHPSMTQIHALIDSNLAALERITELEWGG